MKYLFWWITFEVILIISLYCTSSEFLGLMWQINFCRSQGWESQPLLETMLESQTSSGTKSLNSKYCIYFQEELLLTDAFRKEVFQKRQGMGLINSSQFSKAHELQGYYSLPHTCWWSSPSREDWMTFFLCANSSTSWKQKETININ